MQVQNTKTRRKLKNQNDEYLKSNIHSIIYAIVIILNAINVIDCHISSKKDFLDINDLKYTYTIICCQRRMVQL